MAVDNALTILEICVIFVSALFVILRLLTGKLDSSMLGEQMELAFAALLGSMFLLVLAAVGAGSHAALNADTGLLIPIAALTLSVAGILSAAIFAMVGIGDEMQILELEDVEPPEEGEQ